MTTDLEKLRRALQTMPRFDRAVFERARFHDMSYIDIAADLDLTVAEVEKRLVSAMRHLRDSLD